MLKKYTIKLSPDERAELQTIANKQTVAAQKKLRAQALLASDQGEQGPGQSDAVISKDLSVSTRTLIHVRQWACEVGPLKALERRPTTKTYLRKLDGRAEARLITLAKEDPPTGRAGWTLQLLADRMVELKIVDSLDDNTVWRTLKKTTLSLTSAGIG